MPAMTCSHLRSMPSVSIRWASMVALGRRLRVPGLSNHGDLDRARVLKLGLDAPAQVLRYLPRAVVRHLARRDNDADLAARLDRKGLLDALDRHRELLQALEPLDVVLHRLGARAGPGRRDCVGQD